MGVTYWIPYRG